MTNGNGKTGLLVGREREEELSNANTYGRRKIKKKLHENQI